MSETYPQTPGTTATRSQDRVTYDRAAVHGVLDEALICHVAYLVGEQPLVLPQIHARVGEVLYLHGSSGSHLAQLGRPAGVRVCVTVTLVDGLVLARSAFRHSVNYRSVVVLGTAVEVADEAEKRAALEAVVNGMVPGRSASTRAPSAKELAATAVLRLDLDEVSLKMRTGGPNDLPEDLALPHWAGVLPLTLVPGPPLAAGDAPAEVPDHVTGWPA